MRREFVLRVVSHNVQSLRQPESIELVISFMKESRVDIYAVQETWREGSGVESNKGFVFIRRNEEELKRQVWASCCRAVLPRHGTRPVTLFTSRRPVPECSA